MTNGEELLALVEAGEGDLRRGEPQPVRRRAAAAHARATRGCISARSPRAGIALLRVAKARALADGRDYVSPDDVKMVAAPVLAHG